MPDKSKYDLDFRPKSCWMMEAKKAVLSRIKGASRRQTAALLLEEGMVPAAGDPFFAESLSEGERQLSGSVHPARAPSKWRMLHVVSLWIAPRNNRGDGFVLTAGVK